MLSKEKFIEVMNDFISDKMAADDWINDVEKCFGGAWEPILNHNFETNFVSLLSFIMNDTDGWIEYFIYERNCEWFEYVCNGETIFVNSLEKLYNLIVED